MNRILLPVVGLLLASSSAIAQGIVRPASAAPVAPQQNTVVWLQPVRPIGTYGPLTWTRGPIIGTGVYANRPWVGTPWIVPYGTNMAYSLPLGYSASQQQYYGAPVTLTPLPVAPAPAVAAKSEPAVLSIEFPFSDTQVTVNGVPDKTTGPMRRFESPALAPGKSHAFQIVAKWTKEGKSYEWERTYRMAAGETVRVTIFGGFPVTPPPTIPEKK
jgi:uncharacterized protein (TIGR03000 family)